MISAPLVKVMACRRWAGFANRFLIIPLRVLSSF
jgi:hypothetical protein